MRVMRNRSLLVGYNTRQSCFRLVTRLEPSTDMLRIRAATVDDVPLLKQMLVEFATFEQLAGEVTVTEAELARDGFGPHPRFRALLPEWDGRPAGYAIFLQFL